MESASKKKKKKIYIKEIKKRRNEDDEGREGQRISKKAHRDKGDNRQQFNGLDKGALCTTNGNEDVTELDTKGYVSHHDSSSSENGIPSLRKNNNNKNKKPVLKFPHRYVLAPMVGASELAFRLLCRRYGAQLAYTPMMSAEKFANDDKYRREEFATCDDDRPLVCHFAANHPQTFATAAKTAEPHCDAIDLNLGCPQRTAYLGHYGSYLLDDKDRELVCSMVRAAAQEVKIPIFCKIRLLDSIDDTIRLCQQLCDAGASLIAVHARYRASWERKGPGARDGPALMDQITQIKQAVPNVVIIANGNTITFQDVQNNLKITGADGLMSAEGILDNPALFLPRHDEEIQQNEATTNGGSAATHQKKKCPEVDENIRKLEKKLSKIAKIEKKVASYGVQSLDGREKRKLKKKPKVLDSLAQLEATTLKTTTYEELCVRAQDKLVLANEYLDLAEQYPVKIRSVVFHTRRMMKTLLERYQLMQDCLACQSIADVRSILKKIGHYQKNPDAFIYDKDKAAQEKEALERKRREEGKRKAYEARMVRKAKREGKKDLMHYLHVGAQVPSCETIAKLKLVPRAEALDIWKKHHSQHCLAFHLDTEGCTRGRTCAFLHVDVAAGDNRFEEKDEVAG